MSIPRVAMWQPVDMSFGARTWWAFHCLPRVKGKGTPPELKSFEREHGIPNQTLARIFNGFRKSVTPELLQKIADALGVTTEFLSYGRGEWPELTGPLPEREIRFEGGTPIVPPRYEIVAKPVDVPPGAQDPDLRDQAAELIALAEQLAERAQLLHARLGPLSDGERMLQLRAPALNRARAAVVARDRKTDQLAKHRGRVNGRDAHKKSQ